MLDSTSRYLIVLILFVLGGGIAFADPWQRHVIDQTSQGADGVRLADVNRDGKVDVVTGWEEGGITRLYVHPPNMMVQATWPSITLGKTPSAEDACFADLDGDGNLDVVTCCEGKQQSVFVHWHPSRGENDWRQAEFVACRKQSRWMYSVATDLDGDGKMEMVIGSKNPNGQIAVLSCTDDSRRRDASSWHLTRICEAGWTMSLEITDVDRDGDSDIIASDRRGDTSGVYWLENRMSGSWESKPANWIRHEIGLTGQQEVMFLSLKREKDGPLTIAGCVKPNRCVLFQAPKDLRAPWAIVREIRYPTDKFGTIKSATIGLAGEHTDIFISCESATGAKSGLFFVRAAGGRADSFHDIAGATGTKYDRVELIDVDEDGDQDVLTCEERDGLGVVWYENPEIAD